MEAPPSSELTEEQSSKFDAVLSSVTEWSNSFHGHPLGDHESQFLTRECLLRYLRATKWNVNDTLKRLDATLLWRRERRLDELAVEGELMDELKTGKLIPLGHDNEGRPCLYYNLSYETSELSDTQLNHLCLVTARTIDMLQPGIESITVILDLGSVRRAGMPSMSKIRAYVSAFQDHNPERLGLVIVATSLPWWFHGLWKLIQRFLDPVVRDKIRFDKNVGLYVGKEHLWAKYDGDLLEPEIDQDVYWGEFLSEAEKRRDEYVKRWEAAGKRIGESEWYLRGGVGVTSDDNSSEREEDFHDAQE